MLSYIDESGSIHPNAPESISTLTAVCIPQNQVRSVMSKMFNIKNDLYPEKIMKELKASKTLRPRSVQKDYKSKQFIDRVVKEVICNSDIKVFAIAMNRPKQTVKFPKEELPNHYRLLIQRINGYAFSQKKSSILAFDSQDEDNDRIISQRIKNYLYKSSEGKKCGLIVESAFFVNSKVEDGIQLADLCAGIIRKYYELCFEKVYDDEFSLWIADLYFHISKQTETVVSLHTDQYLYGIYKMPDKYLYDKNDE
ncbi:DUF3800 domain-containing protein [Radiobacillus sp. PE A8.2]|uniref:DUF3800 domain-containing protein n=1 Tax=Radiobacillus sp. PE A8.2 TaxID=3380349 RepID=UPI00388E5A8C